MHVGWMKQPDILTSDVTFKFYHQQEHVTCDMQNCHNSGRKIKSSIAIAQIDSNMLSYLPKLITKRIL